MINNFKNIIQSTVEMYYKDPSHPAIKYEVIGIVSDALEQMNEEEIIAFDKWFFSENMRKELKEDEMRVIKILDEIMN